MSEQIYEFNARNASPPNPWDTNPAKMVDGTETSYAETADGGDEEELTGNECVGTDLGIISKVELRFYGYGDDNDKVILTPVFAGGDGDDHTVVPGVGAGWKAWQEITSDTNSPRGIDQSFGSGGDTDHRFGGASWAAQTFTPASGHDICFVELYIEKGGSPGDVTVSIRAVDGDNKPTGADLASATVSEGDISSPKAWIRFVFATPASLIGSTMYAIVVRAPSGDGSSNYIDWHYDLGDGYASGTKATSGDSGVVWALQASEDFYFREGTWWSWPDIQNLDCDVEYDNVSKSNTMYVGMVQIQVTYEPVGPPTGQPMIIRTRGIPTGPGSRIGGAGWN